MLNLTALCGLGGLVVVESVSVTLSGDEALVLFEWVVRLNEGEADCSMGAAEKIALWSLESVLEGVLPEPFSRDYEELLQAARVRLESSGLLDE